MNYIVPTFMRCGSTLVTRGICGLLDVEYEPFDPKLCWKISEKDSVFLTEGKNRVIKTHHLVPSNLLYLAMANKVGIISVRRRFLDVLSSYILYHGKKRSANKEHVQPTFEKFNKLYGDLPDQVYVNCFIDMKIEFVREQAKLWLKHDRSFCCKNHVAFDYDTIWKAGHEYMLEKLIDTFNLSVDQADFDRALECCKFEPQGSNNHQRQGLPKDGIRLIDKSLRDQLNTIVQQERSKLRNL